MKHHNTRQLSLNQLTTIIILFLIGGSAFSSTGRYSGQNVWIVLLIAGFFGAGLFTIFHRINTLHHNQGLPDILKSTFGQILGTVILFAYACFFFFRTLSVGNYMSAMAQQTLMFGVNHRVVITMLIITVVVCTLHGLTAIGRSSEVFLFLILLCMLPFLLAIFTSSVFKMENLIPILAEGVPSIVKDVTRNTFFPFGELVIFLMLFPYLVTPESKGVLKRSYISIAIAVLLMIAINLTIVALIGATLTSNFEYPFYNAMQLAGLTGFLERLDPLSVVIMVVGEYFKLVIYFFVTVLAFQALNKRFNFKIVLTLLAILCFFVAPIVHVHETGFMMDVVPFRILPIFELALPLLIWIVSEIRFRKKSPQLTGTVNPELA
ncbi:MAG: endospore germination permease [Defluviitaleaceae bacterium]|nr:endospore germination permease [Defluviitaleaceae bacterium]